MVAIEQIEERVRHQLGIVIAKPEKVAHFVRDILVIDALPPIAETGVAKSEYIPRQRPMLDEYRIVRTQTVPWKVGIWTGCEREVKSNIAVSIRPLLSIPVVVSIALPRASQCAAGIWSVYSDGGAYYQCVRIGIEVYVVIETGRIPEVCRAIACIGVAVDSTCQASRVFADEPLQLWVVVSGAVEIEIARIEFTAGVGERVRGG